MQATSSGTATVTLPTDEQILIVREFDAPRHLVYRAYTVPELVRRWWSGHRGEMTGAEIDLRVGGAWRYVMVAHGGFEVAFHGEYREIVPNERIVNTEVYEGMPEGEALTTVTFAEREGRTTLTMLMQLATRQERDAILATGMEGGMQESMDRLEEVAASLGEVPAPDPRLRALDPLVGRWTITGDAEGTTSYEWMEGGFFLLQRGRLTRDGTTHEFLEVIGFERGFAATEAPADITARVYTTAGDTLDYVYEADAGTVIIWGGEKGSPAAFRGTWDDDRRALRGAWAWPGGGYATVMTRVGGTARPA